MKLTILDERKSWAQPLGRAATRRGWKVQHIADAADADGDWVFFRPHASPAVLQRNKQRDWPLLRRNKCIQDDGQVLTYDDKRHQVAMWSHWMPETKVFEQLAPALDFAHYCPLPIVSKADVGASSVNVRVISERQELIEHIQQLFGDGVVVSHCDSKGTTSLQKDYCILQRFIQHKVTYRVNIIGKGRAIFRRYCYKDRPVAQTGNVDFVSELDKDMHSLLAFADAVADDIETKWCALDILRDGQDWRLLETSLAWPWPGAGETAPIFRTAYQWPQMWDCMLDQIEGGYW